VNNLRINMGIATETSLAARVMPTRISMKPTEKDPGCIVKMENPRKA
jgi:hypothetical protein